MTDADWGSLGPVKLLKTFVGQLQPFGFFAWTGQTLGLQHYQPLTTLLFRELNRRRGNTHFSSMLM